MLKNQSNQLITVEKNIDIRTDENKIYLSSIGFSRTLTCVGCFYKINVFILHDLICAPVTIF